MRRDLLMPKLGLTMTEGLVAEWLVAEGAAFRAGDVLFLVETEKVVNEVLAEQDGVLLRALVPAGDTVPVGTPIAQWEDGTGEGTTTSALVRDGSRAAVGTGEAAGAAAGAAVRVATPEAPRAQDAPKRIVSTPLARRLALLHGVDLAVLRGTGPRGRIKAEDVLAAQASMAPSATAPVAVQAAALVAPAPVPAMAGPAARAESPRAAGAGEERPPAAGHRVETPSTVQFAIARRLVAVKQAVPHFYLSVDADVRRLLALRAELNAGGPHRLTMTHFIVAALGRALADEPTANRVWIDDSIVAFDAADVGLAVDTERGLFVPVVRDVARQSLPRLARQADALIGRARAGRLGAADTSGGAITVSNAGMHGVAYMTPIINPGQAMILGVGSVRELFRPDAAGQPELRRELGLVLACDHRLLDGVSGLRFLNRVVHYIEQPLQLVLGA